MSLSVLESWMQKHPQESEKGIVVSRWLKNYQSWVQNPQTPFVCICETPSQSELLEYILEQCVPAHIPIYVLQSIVSEWDDVMHETKQLEVIQCLLEEKKTFILLTHDEAWMLSIPPLPWWLNERRTLKGSYTLESLQKWGSELGLNWMGGVSHMLRGSSGVLKGDYWIWPLHLKQPLVLPIQEDQVVFQESCSIWPHRFLPHSLVLEKNFDRWMDILSQHYSYGEIEGFWPLFLNPKNTLWRRYWREDLPFSMVSFGVWIQNHLAGTSPYYWKEDKKTSLSELMNTQSYSGSLRFPFSFEDEEKGWKISHHLRVPFLICNGGQEVWVRPEVLGRTEPSPLRSNYQILWADYHSRLQPGDFVVHPEYGVARFRDMQSLSLGGGGCTDLIRLEFAEHTLLSFPLHECSRLRRYRPRGEEVTLDTLSGSSWTKRVSKIRKQTEIVVQKVLEMRLLRMNQHIEPIQVDEESLKEFQKSFPHQLTLCQERVLKEILGDLASGRPMWRLLVGDVGFGKTELAWQSIFCVIQAGYQAIFLVPTAILAEQHYQNALQRFAHQPIRIGLLTGHLRSKQKKDVEEQIARGEIDLLISTHRVVLSPLPFQRLGLFIIDEEHKFGVEQKEFIYQQFPLVHMLYMSATPIPRTLHLALSGMMDLSLLSTPPKMRKSVVNTVSFFDPDQVIQALRMEKNRGGQSFFVSPRIKDLEEREIWLKQALPDFTFLKVHGDLPGTVIDQNLGKFLAGEADVLLTTNMIEAGMDFPRANTIVVDRSEYLGLAQLYQLRGRVGRRQTQGYAYFMVSPPESSEDEPILCQDRFLTLERMQDIGQGFHLAIQDLEIRGAGTTDGYRQSGVVKGIDLKTSCEMIQENIQALYENMSPEERPSFVQKIPYDLKIEFLPFDLTLNHQVYPDLKDRFEIYQKVFFAPDIEALRVLERKMERQTSQPLESSFQKLCVFQKWILKIQGLGIILVRFEEEGVCLRWKKDLSEDERQKLLKLLESRFDLAVRPDGFFQILNTPPPFFRHDLERALNFIEDTLSQFLSPVLDV